MKRILFTLSITLLSLASFAQSERLGTVPKASHLKKDGSYTAEGDTCCVFTFPPNVLVVHGDITYWQRKIQILQACSGLMGEGSAPYSQVVAGRDSLASFINELVAQLKPQVPEPTPPTLPKEPAKKP